MLTDNELADIHGTRPEDLPAGATVVLWAALYDIATRAAFFDEGRAMGRRARAALRLAVGLAATGPPAAADPGGPGRGP